MHLLKELLANLGVNLTIPAAERCTKALRAVEDLLASIDSQLEVKRPSGRHTVTRSKADFEAIVNELHVRGMCSLTEQRITGSKAVSSISREACGVT